MNKLDIFILDDERFDRFELQTVSQTVSNLVVKININNLSNMGLSNELDKIKNVIKIYPKIIRINIVFDNKIQLLKTNQILSLLNNTIYSYYPRKIQLKLYQVKLESKVLMEQLFEYKHIVMNPDKNPDYYLKWIQSNVPSNYKINVTNLSDSELFPLTKAVGAGSRFNSYFVHISPKNENPNNKNVFLIGKAITYDSGGLNLKNESMVDMKTDMAGSALITIVLKILAECELDANLNIHLIIPIAENMIGPNSTKPSEVIKTMSGKLVEIVNIDAEGRLCITDGLDYINLYLLKNKNPKNCLIIDIATLTGNATSITNCISSVIMSNEIGKNYKKLMMGIGDNIGEYLDTLIIREEHLECLKSQVADIKNINLKASGGCLLAGAYLEYFTDSKVPWLHIDFAPSAFINGNPTSYGVNLLFNFLKYIKN